MFAVLRPFLPYRHQLAAALVLAAALPVAAQPTLPPLCQLPTATEGVALVRVDAGTGRIDPADGTRFPANTPVEVVLHNKNPFLYEYTVVVEAEDLEARIIQSFLGLAGIREPGAPSVPVDAQPTPGPEAAATPTRPKCDASALPTEAQAACRSIEKVESKVDQLERELEELNEALESAANSVGTVWKAATSTAEFPGCEAIVPRVIGIRDQLDQLISLEAGGRSPSSLREAARDQEALVRAAHTRLVDTQCQALPADQQDDCRMALVGLRAYADLVERKAERVQDDARELSDAYAPQVATRKAQKELIATVLGTPNSFVDTIRLARRPDPTAFRLTVKSKQREAPHAETSHVLDEIVVGTSRFSISGGIGISVLEARVFGRQSGLDETGAVVPVFAVTEEADERVVGLVQLNGCLANCTASEWSFHWSLGLGVGAGDEASEISLYTGPAAGFIDGKLLLTLAYHQRERDELVGFAVGDPIPDDLMDPLPTRRESAGAVLMTVTYKLR